MSKCITEYSFQQLHRIQCFFFLFGKRWENRSGNLYLKTSADKDFMLQQSITITKVEEEKAHLVHKKHASPIKALYEREGASNKSPISTIMSERPAFKI